MGVDESAEFLENYYMDVYHDGGVLLLGNMQHSMVDESYENRRNFEIRTHGINPYREVWYLPKIKLSDIIDLIKHLRFPSIVEDECVFNEKGCEMVKCYLTDISQNHEIIIKAAEKWNLWIRFVSPVSENEFKVFFYRANKLSRSIFTYKSEASEAYCEIYDFSANRKKMEIEIAPL
ncbi:hypothetical protein [Rubellicoccus peritrichatus]|uniref:Uncharacterized protein n=1 Tax=Rubellicoccus peritrichatus TaxID=3080537 RepID=A0AAQ3QQB8_9BACT|nr:hypothetical protein [Puniceicoccus sp. CR14]WOO40073.1 hypothetical protein RZN69_15725 [Puniceicoccus sp. CR14]